MTLLEVMIASALATVIAIGLGAMEVGRVRMTEEVRRQAGLENPERKNAALAAIHLANSLEMADRYLFDEPTGEYLIRMPLCTGEPPDPTCFDDADNYQWVQYRLNGDELRLYRFARPPAGCPASHVLASEIGAMTLESTPPDNNIVHYAVTWQGVAIVGGKTEVTGDHVFQGDVVTRFRSDVGVPFGLQDPSQPDVSPPPAACP